MKTKRIVVQNDRVPANPLKWMEWQARRGCFGLMMPLNMMEPQVARECARRAVYDHHAGARFDRIARAIARDYSLPKFRVRARLLQMGHIAAKGALNYVDGRYIEPFAFSAGNGEGNTSFVVDRKASSPSIGRMSASGSRFKAGNISMWTGTSASTTADLSGTQRRVFV